MLRLFTLLVFSVLNCDGQYIGGPFYPKAIGLSGGDFGGGHLVGGGGHLGGGGGYIGGGGGHLGGGGGHIDGGVGHWYPGLSLGGGFGGAKIGGGGIGGGGIGGGGGGGAGIGLGGHKAIGGEAIDGSFYEGGKKNLNNHHFIQSHGKKEEELKHGTEGFAKGALAEKDVKGEAGHFSDVNGGKNLFHEGKDYHGAQHYSKEGHGGNEHTNKKGHKKGHKINGFKKSHHLDEHGHNEEYYDEDHDEGGNYAFQGESAGFGEKGASSFKGGHEGGKYNAGENKKSGHYGHEYLSDKAEGKEDKFGGHKYSGHGGASGEHKVVGSDDISGYENSKKYFKHFPLLHFK